MGTFTASEGHASLGMPAEQYPTTIALTDEGYVEWKLQVPKTGWYNIAVDYYPAPGKGAIASRSLKIDGKLPFAESGNLLFYRSYINETPLKPNEQGNQIRPSQVEAPVWLRTVLHDASGYYADPLKFYLTAGEHILRLDAVKEPLIIGAITFSDETTVPAYSQRLEEYERAGYSVVQDARIELQGEDAVRKSDSTLYPIADSSSYAISPSSAKNQLLNTIGGGKWQTSGQWLEWDFTAPKSGLYRLTAVGKQDLQSGQPSGRRLLIDGAIPFEEAKALRFDYDTSYQVYSFPYLFYLEEGEHTLRLEVTIGEFSSIVQQMSDIVAELNKVYRSMLMLIGSSPDVKRDYQLDELMPAELKVLGEQTEALRQLRDSYEQMTGQRGVQYQILKNAVQLLDRMCQRHDRIPRLFGSFGDTITSLGNWVVTARSQPLQLDYLLFDSPDEEEAEISSSFFSELLFDIKKFYYSFLNDYSKSLENSDGKKITVWVSSGRDQSTALNQMILNQFTPASGIPVNLQLVPAGTLLMAAVAGKGPDVALGNSQTDTINYAIRGAVVDLATMEGYKEIQKRFHASACDPLSYRGSWYGVPETQTFFVTFYRKDIFESLGLSVPETWDDLLEMLPVLSENNMTVGLPPVLQTYTMLLNQFGGELYNEDRTACLIDSAQGIRAFDFWVKLYTEYGLPVEYDFITRFRSGEMPLGVVDYATYNMLSAFAPELESHWGIDLVPGVRREDGTVNHDTTSVVTSTVLMSASDKQRESWEFMKWWTSAEVQTKYGNELESILGTTGRYQPANMDSLYNIPWNTGAFNLLMKQWNDTRAIPEIPGSYMTARYLDFAFKRVVVNSDTNSYLKDSGQIMIDTAGSINAELRAKLKEFHLAN